METVDKTSREQPQLNVSTRIWTVGNFLSISRVLVLPLLIWIHQANDYQPSLELKVLLGYIVLSDFLDGFASRALNQISELGKWLDPLADKICAVVLFAYVWVIGLVSTWMFMLILGRDIFILIGSAIIKKKRGKVAMSVMSGKITVNVLSAYWLVLVFFPEMELLVSILEFASLAMLLFSGLMYLRRGYHILQGAHFV